MTKKIEKIRDNKGYAYLVANVGQFGNDVVRIMQGYMFCTCKILFGKYYSVAVMFNQNYVFIFFGEER